jgi:hypothetical protein
MKYPTILINLENEIKLFEPLAQETCIELSKLTAELVSAEKEKKLPVDSMLKVHNEVVLKFIELLISKELDANFKYLKLKEVKK